MNQPVVQFEASNDAFRITLNRPEKRNALSRELLEELSKCLATVAESDTCRLLLIDAAGPAFCAGMDLQEMESRAGQPDAQEQWQRDTQIYHDVLVQLLQLSIPTCAVVNGAAVAGGFGLVLACDLVLAADSAFFALPEPKRGITAAILIPLLLYRTNVSTASYIALSGNSVSAQQGHTMGICHEVATADELGQRTEELQNSILTGAASSLAITKERIWSYDGERLLAELADGMTASAAARETNDAREGLAAFLERRNPSWYPQVD